MKLELIAAVAKNGVIGRAGQLPWHLPDDLKHFKSLTLGHPIIMGRKTFESIGRALPGRRSIVVSETLATTPPGIELANSLDDAVRIASTEADRAFVIGGGVLYSAALPRADILHLTEIDQAVEGDAFFPAFDHTRWKLTGETFHPADERHAAAFRFCRYEVWP